MRKTKEDFNIIETQPKTKKPSAKPSEYFHLPMFYKFLDNVSCLCIIAGFRSRSREPAIIPTAPKP